MLEGPWELSLALFAAFCIGISKAGFSGTSLLAVAIFSHLYGAKAQAGLALPLLIMADLIVYPAFRKHGSWKDVWRFLPAALVGLMIGWWLLGNVSELLAKRIIGVAILMMLALQGLRAWKPGVLEKMADHHAFGTGAGVAGGVTTMLANAAGPVIQLYLLSRRLPKMEMIGIGARFFLLINLIKVPINGQLNLITSETLIENLKLAPAIVVGIYLGKWLLQKVPQRAFEWMILGFAALAAVRMLVG
ncbi:MAG: sulfite exporter TauE/SafE family protein [Verrucomicrobiota bacterium]